MQSKKSEKFCGQIINSKQLFEIKDIVETFPNLSRAELANTVCEIFSWKRPTGKLKSIECRQFLESLSDKGFITLPACRKQYANNAGVKIRPTGKTDIQQIIRLFQGSRNTNNRALKSDKNTNTNQKLTFINKTNTTVFKGIQEKSSNKIDFNICIA